MILLSDWVFAQLPKSMKQAVSLVVDGLGLRYALNGSRVYRGFDAPWILPKNNGKDELIQRCFDLLQSFPARDFARELIYLLRTNATRDELLKIWRKAALHFEGEKRSSWIDYGLLLGLLPLLEVSELENLMSDNQDRDERYYVFFRARRMDFFEQSGDRLEHIVDLILDGIITSYPERRTNTILEQLVHTLDPIRYAISFQSRHPTPLAEYREMRFLYHSPYHDPELSENEMQIHDTNLHPLLKMCTAMIEEARIQSQRTGQEWATSLDPWNCLVEKSRSFFGERWSHFHLANIASGIKSRDETYPDYGDLFNRGLALCRRARYARLRAGNPRWWEEQSKIAESELDQMFLLLTLLTWGSNNTILALMGQIMLFLDGLSEPKWQIIVKSLQQATGLARVDTATAIVVDDLPDGLTFRTATAIAMRVRDPHISKIYRKYLFNYDGTDSTILELCQRAAMQLLRQNDDNWRQHLKVLQRSYAQGVVADEYDYHLFARELEIDLLPLEVAQRIAQEPENYPHYLTSIAEARWRKEVSTKIKPVGETAKEEGWFSELGIWPNKG